MSTLTVTNIKATGETASRAVSGVAAAWAHFNFGSVIQDSVNFSSLTDNSTGKSSLNITSAMGNATYAASNSPRNPTGGAAAYWACVMDDHPAYPRTVSKVSFCLTYGDQNEEHHWDGGACGTSIHGDLA